MGITNWSGGALLYTVFTNVCGNLLFSFCYLSVLPIMAILQWHTCWDLHMLPSQLNFVKHDDTLCSHCRRLKNLKEWLLVHIFKSWNWPFLLIVLLFFFCLNKSCGKKDLKKTSWCQPFALFSDFFFKQALNVVWNMAIISFWIY